MPAAKKASTAVTRRSSGPSPKLRRLEDRMKNAQRKRATEKKQRLADMSAVAGGAALGWIDRAGWQNPIDIPGVDDAAVYGVVLYLLADRFIPGRAGDMSRGAAVGMMACAARSMAAGE